MSLVARGTPTVSAISRRTAFTAANDRNWRIGVGHVAKQPNDALEWLLSLEVPWWLAGGWALDLFVGQVTRKHGDLDVGVLRRDWPKLAGVLSAWDIYEARDGMLSRLPLGIAPGAEVNSLWCQRSGSRRWDMEVMLDASDGDFWVFRRNATIRRPIAEIVRRNRDGIPHLAPEVQLLYKARLVTRKDQADFDKTSPRLDCAARVWLSECLRRQCRGTPG